jgi:N-acetylneuraminate synthase
MKEACMPAIKIGDRLVGDGHPTYIIAEIGINHNGILPLAMELIDVAVDAGADAEKFQKRSLEQLYAKKYLENANSGEKTLRYLLPILQRVELPDSAYYQLVDCAGRKKLHYAQLSTSRVLTSWKHWTSQHKVAQQI